MKLTMLLTIACLASLTQGTLAETTNSNLIARPIQIVSCAPLPAGIAFDVKPMGYETGFEVFYLAEGSGFAAVKEDSLLISSIKTKDGIDISRTRTGKPSYEQGPFPKVSEDGKYAVFSVKVGQQQFGKVESLTMLGSVVVLAASQREVKSVTLPVAERRPQPLGPFTVVPQTGGGANLMGMMMGGSDFGIEVKGPLSSIIDVELVSNGAATKSEGNMSDGTSKTFVFSKPSGSSVSFRINYWTDLREQKVTFGK